MPDSDPDSGIGTVERQTAFRFRSRRFSGWPLNALLFCVTVVSTTAFGVMVVDCFHAGRPLDLDSLFAGYAALFHWDPVFWHGLYFSVPLLLILLSHEFGHYVACRRTGVDATLPFFLPSPALLGTLGAFIRIKSPIYSRTQLFDIGISGPVAGFAALLPFLIAGSAWSMPLRVPHAADAVTLGLPLAMRAAEWVTLGKATGGLALHPFAVAAWAGLLATAMNLIPIGQLDGGHILYAAAGERWHKLVSWCFLIVLVGLGLIYWAWWIWAVVLFLVGRRHPLVYDTTPIRRGRGLLGVVALGLFLLSIVVAPVSLR
jgi:membrane-associated protease RseP (regulator of RpoE activity)